MRGTITAKLIEDHLVDGDVTPGTEIGLRVDQTLTQDATGTLVMLELEAMELDRVRTELSAQYVDHNLIQQDFKNPDDHRFLRSICRKLGVWYSRPGNGVSHPVHQERFGVPGKTLVGSDSHTPAAGAIGMLAIGAGGLEVALAMAGEPLYLPMPEVWGVELVGELPDWVSAKDVILEMLRRHGVRGGRGRVIEYHGPGLASLAVMDRHVIANMGTELGATSTVFPADDAVRRFLRRQGREDDFAPLVADDDAEYDHTERIDLSALEPLVALPTSPGNVVPVREVAGEPIYQSYVGSSANPGYRDFAVVAEIVRGRQVHPDVSLDINPTSRQVLQELARDGHVGALLSAGARLHQAGCNGCIGMGQAPATGQISLRTVPRNFPGRSGTKEDQVHLVSPETAAASALRGAITDPRDLDGEMAYPRVEEPAEIEINREMLEAPPSPEEAAQVEPIKGPNIASLPALDRLPERIELPVLLRVGDDVSTDEIMPAGSRILPFRSNIPRIAEFVYEPVDPSYPERARSVRDAGGHVIVAGDNYGQGSSREHAAIAPRHLGLRVVLARSYARIHQQNLINFGVLPLTFADPDLLELVAQGDDLSIDRLANAVERGDEALQVTDVTRDATFEARLDVSERQREVLLAGGLINWMKQRLAGDESTA